MSDANTGSPDQHPASQSSSNKSSAQQYSQSHTSDISSWRLSAKLARRYYYGSYKNPYIRFINKASTIGIGIGVFALILGLSVMNGFEKSLKESLLSVIPDVEFEAVSGYLDNWQSTQQTIMASPSVKAAAPYIKLNGMLQMQQQLIAVMVHGVEPDLEKKVNLLPAKIIQGNWLKQMDKGVVIGSALAKSLQLNIGSSVELLLPNKAIQGKILSPYYLRLPVVGIYHIGGQQDQGQVFVPLHHLQQVFDWPTHQAEGIKVALHEPFNAQRIGRAIGHRLTDYVYVLDWFRTQGHNFNDIIMVKQIMLLVMILVIAVACFNIVSSLTMAVQEKRGDIGILKTMGIKPVVIQRVFIFMGLFTAIKGVIWGAVSGLVFAFQLPQMLNAIEQWLNFKTLDSSVYFIDHIPTKVEFSQVLITMLLAIFIATIATLYPARKAAKLSPKELIE